MTDIAELDRISELERALKEADGLYNASIVNGLPSALTLSALALRSKAIEDFADAVGDLAA